MNVLSFDRQVRVISALVEGCSLRATERLTGANRETVGNLALHVGERCAGLHDALMCDLRSSVLELDEIWAFIGKKQRQVRLDDSPEMGDCYTYIGLDANRKAIISYAVGKRDAATTNAFALDLRSRVLGRPQITTDGFAPYVDAIRRAFGDDVDYGMLIKQYGNAAAEDQRRYSPPRCVGAKKVWIAGDPDYERTSTSYVERGNLTIRMQVRRFTRLTNAFSKKMRNHAAAVALHVVWHNFCRVHETLRTTPAIAVGVADHVWSVAELVDMALSIVPMAPVAVEQSEPMLAPWQTRAPVALLEAGQP